MANLTDARILYRAWAQCFDPGAGSFERLSSSHQEAWLYVAATARMLDALPEPPPAIIPGLLHMATWSAHDRWGDIKAPAHPQVVLTLEATPGVLVIETERGSIPIFNHVLTPPKEVKRIPGLIYTSTPVYEHINP